MIKNKKLDLLKNFWCKKKVFITGHSGFKGTWLCIILNLLKSQIHGYSLKPEKKSLFNESKIYKNLSSNTFADIDNLTFLKKKIKKIKPEIIFHLAAQPLVLKSYKDPIDTFRTNIMGTVNLLDCIRNTKSIKSVVIITTDKVYKINKNNHSYKESDLLGGLDPYSTSKVAVELIVDSYIKSFFGNSKLKNKISTARAGNVIGGGDYSNNRLVPDIIKSINSNKKLMIRNPSYVRPWQHVIEPLIGYLMLAEVQYKNLNNKDHSYNFGPRKNNFKKVYEVIKIMKNFKNFSFKIAKSKKNKETEVLKLNSFKSQKKLKWKPTWDLKTTLKRVFEWNELFKKGFLPKSICEKQFLMYLNNK